MSAPVGADIPLDVRVELTIALLQHVADTQRLDILHIKGAALDPSLRWRNRSGSDADVLVRPTHVAAFIRELTLLGFAPEDTFVTGSPFGHAVAMSHQAWAPIDVHRFIPGPAVDPDLAFDLWTRGSSRKVLGGVPCLVPTLPAQALVLLLHAARAGASMRARYDVTAVWTESDDQSRAAIEALAVELGAELPLAIAIGRDTSAWAGRPDYRLWMAVSRGSTRADEWRARIAAAPTWSGKGALAVRALLPNAHSLATRLGRPPTRRDMAVESVARLRRGFGEALGRRLTRTP